MRHSSDVVQLRDVVELVKTKWVPPSSDEQLVELFSIPAFDNGAPEIIDASAVGSAKTLIRHSCVLLSKINPRIPRVWLIDGGTHLERICSTEFVVLKPREPQDLGYLYYLLKSTSFRRKLLTMTTGSSGSHQRVNAEDILATWVYWPSSYETRDEISWKLSLLDKKVTSNTEVQRLLEQCLQLRFQELLNRGPDAMKLVRQVGGGDARRGGVGGERSEMQVGVQRGGWSVGLLSEFDLVIESGRRPKGGVKWIKDGVPSIGAESINGLGRFDWRTVKFVPRDFFDSLKKGIPKDFDVLLYKDGGQPGVFKPRLGMFGLGFPFDEFAINEHIFLLRSEQIPPAYLYFWMAQEWILDILRDAGVKGAQPGINQADVQSIPIAIPPRSALEQFNRASAPVVTLILALARETRLLSLVRNSIGNELLPFISEDLTGV